MDVLRTLLIILIVYYSFRFSRFFVPFLLRFFLKKLSEIFSKIWTTSLSIQTKEGEVTVDSSSTNKQKKATLRWVSMLILGA